MSIWKITTSGPVKVKETKLKKEELLEEHLEDWLIADPSILGESLLFIGRQVMIPDIRDRLDILALDPQGNAVIIELKRGTLKDPVDMQALRYASYLSKWRFQDFENQARIFLGKQGDQEFNFNEIYEQFCTDSGTDDVPDINIDQRMIIMGSEVKDKLGSVALWLREHKIDIKVIEVEVFKEGETLFLQPQTIIPLPVSKFIETGQISRLETSQLWREDGKSWHLEKRCSVKTREMLLRINDILLDNFEVDGPRWNQKFYVAYRVGNFNWLVIITSTSTLRMQFYVQAGSFDEAELAQQLSIEVFDVEDTFAEKIGLPSSVFIQNRNEATDRIYLRVKDDFDLESEAFLNFLQSAFKAYNK